MRHLRFCLAIAVLAVLGLSGGPARAQGQMMPLGGADFSDWYTIVDAAARNKIDDVRAKLVSGENANTVSSEGSTALIYAASFGNADMTKLLLDHGANVDEHDKFGQTALHWAATKGSLDVLRLLIAAKASIDAQNTQGQTPLMLAADKGKTQAVRFLLQHGADPTKEDYTGRDAKGWATGKPSVMQLLNEAKRG